MMNTSILHSNNLARAKELLEKYKFNVQGYVDNCLPELYDIGSPFRPRVAVRINSKLWNIT